MKPPTKDQILKSIGHHLAVESDAEAIVKLEALGATQEAHEAEASLRKRLTNPRMLAKFDHALAQAREEEFAE